MIKNSTFNRIKLVLLMVAFVAATFSLSAQHYVGIRGGLGGGTVRFEPARETAILFIMPSAGVSWKYYSPVKYVGAIGADIQYMQRGYKLYPHIGSDTSYQRRVETIEMPFMWQPHIYLFDRHGRVFMNLGVYASYAVGSSVDTVSRKMGSLGSGNYEMKLVRDNKWGYGLCGGFGFGMLFDKIEVLVEARYYYGYSDLLKNRTVYPLNPYQRSPLDAINFSFGIYYRLGKGGILAPTSIKKRTKDIGNFISD